MIKVLEHGTRKVTCSNCKAKLQFEQTDIIAEKRPGGKQYIICPDCGAEIILNKPTKEKDSNELDIDL
jgi:DNA-directed RNA polymerase subunit RPC12/RpoP